MLCHYGELTITTGKREEGGEFANRRRQEK